MKVTRHNYLQVDYCRHDTDKFYIGERVQIRTEHYEVCGKIHSFSDQHLFLTDGMCSANYVWYDEITSIRKVVSNE